jgi:hypothetical protein
VLLQARPQNHLISQGHKLYHRVSIPCLGGVCHRCSANEPGYISLRKGSHALLHRLSPSQRNPSGGCETRKPRDERSHEQPRSSRTSRVVPTLGPDIRHCCWVIRPLTAIHTLRLVATAGSLPGQFLFTCSTTRGTHTRFTHDEPSYPSSQHQADPGTHRRGRSCVTIWRRISRATNPTFPVVARRIGMWRRPHLTPAPLSGDSHGSGRWRRRSADGH